MQTLFNLWVLSRPHAMKAHLLAVFIMFALAYLNVSQTIIILSYTHVVLLFVSVFISSAALNIYTQAVNQLYDLKIDQINKPFLPYASGYFSRSQMFFIIIISALLSFLFSLCVNFVFFLTILSTFILATIYSVPPFRLKRYPLGPTLIITLGRGVIFHNGLYLSYQFALSGELGAIPAHVLLLTTFLSVFSIVIAVSKDIPDVEGDKAYGIRSLSVTISPKSMFNFVKIMITAMYIIWTMAYWYFWNAHFLYLNLWLISLLHLVMLAYFWNHAQQVAAIQKEKFLKFYEGPFWNLFYVEFVGFFVACLV